MPSFPIDPAAIETSEGPRVIAATGQHPGGIATEPHRHARGQLLGSQHGLLSVRVEDNHQIIPASHAIWIPPHNLHHACAYGAFHGWSVYLAESACANLPAKACTLRTSGLLREAVMRASAWPDGEKSAALRRLSTVIFDEITSLPIEYLGLPLPRDARLLRIAQALIADPADERGLRDWARWTAISERSLSRHFVEETGLNFMAWRQRARLMRSLEMLAAGRPVKTVALDLGYATASPFIALFRRTFGQTPAVYRQQIGGHSPAAAPR